MQPSSGQTATVVHVSPKNPTILQQNSQHILIGKLGSEPGTSRSATSVADTSGLQTTHSNNTVYPAHYIEAIAEQTVYAANGDNSGIFEIKPGTPLRKLFASVTKSLPGHYQEYTPIIYAPVSSGQTYYQTATGQVIATAFGGAGAIVPGSGLHTTGHTNLGSGHTQLVTHQGATYLVQSGQLDDEASAISHTAKASPVTVQWLVDNYETAEGVSLPRSTLYFHYLQHCNEHKLEPMNPASFGKLIRSVFYGLRTRRLGTRGNSKYHYYGIRIKPNSPLNHFVEDAGFSLRHYPNYHRQTMEAAAEWKSFTNSSVSRLKSSSSLSSGNGGSGLSHMGISAHSAILSHGSTPQTHFIPGSLKSDKSFMNTSYGATNHIHPTSSTTETTGTTISSTAVNTTTSTGQHQHAQFLGEASSALPNLDEICRSSGLPVPSEVDLTNFDNETHGSNKSRTSKLGTAPLDPSFCADVITFCRLYAVSAGYMLDAVVNLDFTAIETVWKAFWGSTEVRDSRLKQSLSQERLYALVSDSAVLQFVRLYDHTFYQSLAEVLIPNVLRPIPPTLIQAIRNFAKSLEGWMRQATQGLDSTLVGLKISAVSALAQTLRRYTSLNHLAQAARGVLKNSNQINQMLTDLNRVDFNDVQEQASWVCQCSDATVSQLEQDFKRILHKHASLEEWAQWLDTVVTSILQPLEGNSLAYTRAAHQLILKWSFYSSMVIRDLTLRSALSFGSFHLIRLLYDEYIFYLVEHKVAAHLGMTPVAVMGEMGRNLTQQHYAQSNLTSDFLNHTRRDVKSLCSVTDEDLTSTVYADTENSSIPDANEYVPSVDTNENQQSAIITSNVGLRRSIEPANGDEDEEIDEYLDDEEDVDDSVGDEGAMLKEAHASVQAYCRSSNTVGKVSTDLNDNHKMISHALSGDVSDNNSDINCKNSTSIENSTQNNGNDICVISTSQDDQETKSGASNLLDGSNQFSNDVHVEGSCSPPSIVTVPNPVRKVVRVTTFCDPRQNQAHHTEFPHPTSSPTIHITSASNPPIFSTIISVKSDQSSTAINEILSNTSLNSTKFGPSELNLPSKRLKLA